MCNQSKQEEQTRSDTEDILVLDSFSTQEILYEVPSGQSGAHRTGAITV